MPIFYYTQTSTSATATYCTAATNAYCSPYYGQATSAYWQAQAAQDYYNNAYQEQAQAEVMRAHKKKARDRAHGLLLENLSTDQRETFEKNGWFVVEGGKSGRRYRVNAKDSLVANIDVLDGERVQVRLCGHCDIRQFPLGDHLLAQKLMLESSEDEFLKVANRHAA